MFKVEVERECGCFKKSEYQKEKSFESKDEALLYTEAITELMNEEFCSKHYFSAHRMNENEFVIKMSDGQGGGCCGGGHCS
jgi:hypothetical protein